MSPKGLLEFWKVVVPQVYASRKLYINVVVNVIDDINNGHDKYFVSVIEHTRTRIIILRATF